MQSSAWREQAVHGLLLATWFFHINLLQTIQSFLFLRLIVWYVLLPVGFYLESSPAREFILCPQCHDTVGGRTCSIICGRYLLVVYLKQTLTATTLVRHGEREKRVGRAENVSVKFFKYRSMPACNFRCLCKKDRDIFS
jgi:hypothetical protein